MFVVNVEGGKPVIIGTTRLPEPAGSRPQLVEGGMLYALNYVTEDAIRAWREANAADNQHRAFERSQRAIFLEVGQDPKRLPGWKPCRR